MPALDWATGRAALAAALAGVGPTSAAAGAAILADLDAGGPEYDTAYAVSGVDAAKSAFLTAAEAAHDDADAACIDVEQGAFDPDVLATAITALEDAADAWAAAPADGTRDALKAAALAYAEAEGTGADPALAFEPYSSAAILARIAAASAVAAAASYTGELLAQHRSAVTLAYAGASFTAYTSPPTQRFFVEDANGDPVVPRRYVSRVTGPSVRERELALSALLDNATELIAVLS